MFDKPVLYQPEIIDWKDKGEYSKASYIRQRWEEASKSKIFGYSGWGFVDQPEVDTDGNPTGKTISGRTLGEKEAKQSFFGFMELFTYYKALRNSDYARKASQEPEPNVVIGEKTVTARSLGLTLSEKAAREHELVVSTHNYQIAASFHTHRMYDRFRELGLKHESAYDLCENIIRESITAFQKMFHTTFEKGDPVKRELLHPDHPPKDVTYVSMIDQLGHVHRAERPIAEKKDLEELFKMVNNIYVRSARVY